MNPLIPVVLQNSKDVLFGNLQEIYEFHKRTFLKELENCTEDTDSLGRCFLKRKEDLQIYEKYCQNKPRSEALWRQCAESIFFQECQRKLDHKLSLDAYLLKPVQRITKYQLLLKEMLKCSKNSEGTAELEEALATVLDIIKSVNDSMHQIAITGYEGDLCELGKLLMQGSFNVWTDHKKGHNKVKDLARFKPMQRHLFLYAKTLLFCKKREESTEGHEKSPSYSFKHALKMSSVGITENVKGDNKKFEVWYNGREEVYIIQASSVEQKNLWVTEIRKVLTGQLEACREASQLHQRITESVYHAPMNSWVTRSNKTSLNNQNKADSSSHNSPNNKNRTTSPAGRHTKGPLGPDVKAKRHEIKSDPTPLGLKGWPRHLNSLETYEDFSAIPSSNDELSNSSDIEEETTHSKGSKLFSIESSFETCSPSTFSLKEGDIVQFIQCGENGQWLVKDPITKRKAWVPCNILTPVASANVLQKDNITAYSGTCQMSAASATMKEKQNEHTRSLVTEQKAVS
ncbi:PREDICTED: probable guanine nucleotide exchange factor MCF2L2 [Nanorana parkeri]|uniref:probable guanine nucleotide exchange factor MCF2L2 n=1 Tax=Nanorana parkeri TaxID=125878 RepID=UPI000854BA0C|nr:PREDICTED: probable guanine nucleotide exchange factor MCF2L2 [Nanorana parkeri]